MILCTETKTDDIEAEIRQIRTPLDDKFEIVEKIGTGGLANMWQIFRAFDRQSGHEFSIFVFLKRLSFKIPRQCQRKNRSTILQFFKFDASNLALHKHPRLLKVFEPVQENRDLLCFAAEPLLGSLSDWLSYHNPKYPTPTGYRWLKDAAITELEIRCGILQIAEALTYLHNVAQLMHGSLAPENIFLTKHGAWKLGGLFFAEPLINTNKVGSLNIKNTRWYTISPNTCPLAVQPNLDFLAQERTTENECHLSADVYSLALLICLMYNKEYEPFLTTGQQLPEFHKQCEKIEQKLHKLINNGLDQSLADALKKMLLEESSKRPSPQLFTLIKFFNDRAVLCLRQLEDVEFMDPTTAVHYYSFQLKDALKVIPEELWFRRILPRLEVDLLIHQELTSVIIRPILYMLQNCSTSSVFHIERVFDNLLEDMQNQHKQVLIALLDNADILAGRCANFVNKIFNLLMSALQHPCKNVRNVAVCSIMKISRSFDADRIRNDLVPQLLMLLSVQDQPDHIQCHVIKTLCILLSAINDRGIGQVLDELCRLLRKTMDQNVIIAASRLFMAVLADGKRLRLSPDYLARQLLPSICPLVANANLNENQIRIIIITIQLMVQFLSNEKIPTPEQSIMLNVRRDSIPGNIADGHLQVPHQRMQRRSLGNLFSDISLLSVSTTTDCYTSPSTAGRFLSVSERHVDQVSKISTPTRSVSQQNHQRPSSPNFEYLSSLFSTCFNSQPSSPVLNNMGQRRHSMQVTNESGQQMRKTSRPSSFTNLSHNIVS